MEHRTHTTHPFSAVVDEKRASITRKLLPHGESFHDDDPTGKLHKKNVLSENFEDGATPEKKKQQRFETTKAKKSNKSKTRAHIKIKGRQMKASKEVLDESDDDEAEEESDHEDDALNNEADEQMIKTCSVEYTPMQLLICLKFKPEKNKKWAGSKSFSVLAANSLWEFWYRVMCAWKPVGTYTTFCLYFY